MRKLIPFLFLILFTTACAVGPNYRRPKVDVPGEYRGAAEPNACANSAESVAAIIAKSAASAALLGAIDLGDQKWWEVFQDPQLQELIRAALKQNYDVRIAAARIMEARAQLGITRADQLPTVSAGAAGLNDRFPKTKLTPETETNFNAVGASMAWDLDFWGKYRRATEAARAESPGNRMGAPHGN